MTATRELVRNCLRTDYQSLPEDVVAHAKLSLLNWLGVAIGAAEHASVEMLLNVARQNQSAPTSTIVGRAERVDPLFASLINGMASHVFDFDDTHLRTIHHPSGPVAPPCLALGERDRHSGVDVLRAFALGVEAELRIANAVCPSHYDLGWHVTATTGVFGSALSAGILLGLDEDELVQALGIAGTQSAGLREMFGTMSKPFHPGKAAHSGLLAALMAQQGFTSSTRVLEAPRGFANVMAPQRDLSEITAGWGVSWELLKNSFKPYACGIVLHPAIDACIALGRRFAPEDVSSLTVRVSPYVLELTGKHEPSTGLEGKFSIYHAAAIAFFEGDAGEAQFSDAAVTDKAMIDFREKITPVVDDNMGDDQAHATLTLMDGSIAEENVDHATGSLEKPMTTDDIVRKFHAVSSPILEHEQRTQLSERMLALESEDDIAELVALCVPDPTMPTSNP